MTSAQPEKPEKTTLKRLGAAAALMTAAVFLSRIIGFLRESFVAARFGATGATDAFYAAFTLPDWLNYLLAGGTLESPSCRSTRSTSSTATSARRTASSRSSARSSSRCS